ncbi:hypothetical protein ANRL2_02554 [Anaerolineae bacterium]|nr:hypothetical protein ANRL2_02554 [Anaerolineae bacterium]
MTVAPDAGPEALEEARERLEERLIEITAAADSHFER